MGRGAQSGGTKVLRIRLHRNSATAIAAQMSGVRQIQGARKNKNAKAKGFNLIAAKAGSASK